MGRGGYVGGVSRYCARLGCTAHFLLLRKTDDFPRMSLVMSGNPWKDHRCHPADLFFGGVGAEAWVATCAPAADVPSA